MGFLWYNEGRNQSKRERTNMTREDASRRYQIPLSILEAYESWGLCGKKQQQPGSWEYDDDDLTRLRMITALKDMGFDCEEIKSYMELLEQQGTEARRLEMLEQKRRCALEEIHQREHQVCCLDFLRHDLRKKHPGKP